MTLPKGSTESIVTITPESGADAGANKQVEKATDSPAAEEETITQQVSNLLPESPQQPDILDLIKQTIEQELASATLIPLAPIETETVTPSAPQSAFAAETTLAPIAAPEDEKQENVSATEAPVADEKPAVPVAPLADEVETPEEIPSEPEAVTTEAAPAPSSDEQVTTAPVSPAESIEPASSTQQPIASDDEIQSVDQTTQLSVEPQQPEQSATEQNIEIAAVTEAASSAPSSAPTQEITTSAAEEIESSTPQLLSSSEHPATSYSSMPQTSITDESVESPTTVSQIIAADVPVGTNVEPVAATEQDIVPTEQAVAEVTTAAPTSEEDEASTEVDDSKLAQYTERVQAVETSTSAAAESSIVTEQPQETPEPESPVYVSQQEPAVVSVQSFDTELPTTFADVLVSETVTTESQEQITDAPAAKLPSESAAPAEGTEASVAAEPTTQQPSSTTDEETSTKEIIVAAAPAEPSAEQESAVTEQPSTQSPSIIAADEIQSNTQTEAEEPVTQTDAPRPVQDVLNQEKPDEQAIPIEIEATTQAFAAEADVKQTTEAVQEISTSSSSTVHVTEIIASSEEQTEGSASAFPAHSDELPSTEEKVEEPIATTAVPAAAVEEEQTSSPASQGGEATDEQTPSPSIVTQQPQSEVEPSTSQFEQQTFENIAGEAVTTVASPAAADDQSIIPTTAVPASKTNLTIALDESLGEEPTTSAQFEDHTAKPVTHGVVPASDAPAIVEAGPTNAPTTEAAIEAAAEVSSQSPFKPDLIHSSEEEEEVDRRPTTDIIGPEFRPQSTVDLLNLVTGSVMTEPALFETVPTRSPPTTVAPVDDEPTTVRQQVVSAEEEQFAEIATDRVAIEQHPASEAAETTTTERAQLVETEQSTVGEQSDIVFEPVETFTPPTSGSPSKTDNASSLDERFDGSTENAAALATDAPQEITQRPGIAQDTSTTVQSEEIPAILHNKTEPAFESARPVQPNAVMPTSAPALLSSFASSSTTLAAVTSTQAATTKKPSYQAPPSYDSYGQVSSEYPSSATYTDDEYTDEEEPTVFGPGTCRYGGKLYVSAQQIPRDDPCDFCFCFRSDIICLQQSCPPPISGCHEEPIQGFCCPRYECPVSMALVYNATSTTTTTTLPPHLAHFAINNNTVSKQGCQIQGTTYQKGERVSVASGPCIDCM